MYYHFNFMKYIVAVFDYKTFNALCLFPALSPQWPRNNEVKAAVSPNVRDGRLSGGHPSAEKAAQETQLDREQQVSSERRASRGEETAGKDARVAPQLQPLHYAHGKGAERMQAAQIYQRREGGWKAGRGATGKKGVAGPRSHLQPSNQNEEDAGTDVPVLSLLNRGGGGRIWGVQERVEGWDQWEAQARVGWTTGVFETNYGVPGADGIKFLILWPLQAPQTAGEPAGDAWEEEEDKEMDS
ncbi:hypothetical protein B0H12DRAFT_1069553 [Mycena haematopus]|nr:hypothetical protein B0H12DRAFT_1069553 [Mycena haematopus]